MVTVEEARALILNALPAGREERLPLAKALGRVCAEEIISSVALPGFDNSAMDGFAFRASDAETASGLKPAVLRIVSDILAGDAAGVLAHGQCMRIMTGAPMPAGADTVLPVEEAVEQKGHLVVDRPVRRGRHVRFTGEEIRPGDQALFPGEILNPGTIGFLAGLGIANVRVCRRPRVAVISTGSELVDVGRSLGSGKIYDSNGPMLRAALEEAGIKPQLVRRVQDRPLAMRVAFSAALNSVDVLLVSGGVSKGKADFAKDTLSHLGVETLFWGVRQKPGKPFYFGRKGSVLVFGLPGNPASVFTCFYEYVYPALRRLCGFTNNELSSASLPLESSFETGAHKSLFLKAKRRSGVRESVELLPRQGSHMLSALREADSFVVIPEGDCATVPKGGSVLVHALPYARPLAV